VRSLEQCASPLRTTEIRPAFHYSSEAFIFFARDMKLKLYTSQNENHPEGVMDSCSFVLYVVVQYKELSLLEAKQRGDRSGTGAERILGAWATMGAVSVPLVLSLKT